MPEDDAYYVTEMLIEESIRRCHYLALGNRALVLFGICFSQLVETHLPEIFARKRIFLSLQ